MKEESDLMSMTDQTLGGHVQSSVSRINEQINGTSNDVEVRSVLMPADYTDKSTGQRAMLKDRAEKATHSQMVAT